MRHVLILGAGVLMLLSAGAHAGLGLPMMRGALQNVHAGADLVAGFSTGWLLGSVGMATFGLIVIVSALRLRRHDLSGLVPIRIIAAAYLVFGIGAYVALNFESHFLGFIGIGLLAGLPTVGAK